MIKKIVIGILGFIFGMSIGFYCESFLRGIIQDIFRLATSDKIRFVGKNVSIFSDRTFEYVLGFALMILFVSNIEFKQNRILKNILFCLLIFGISIFVISAIDANIKVIECTACNDGIKKLHWNGINYGLIISLSAVFSIIPSLIRIIKITKKASVQHRV